MPYHSNYNAFFMDNSILLCVLFIFADSRKWWFCGYTWWLLLCNENHFGAVQIGLNLYCCVTSWTWLTKKCKWLLPFQAIININGRAIVFHSGYFDYRGGFQATLDSYCSVTGWIYLTVNHNGYFHFSDEN